MPLDALSLMPLRDELAAVCVGARIDKIQQPGKNEILLSLRGTGVSRRLLVSAASGKARAHFTDASFENPQSPPMFCMLLRKHLAGARICSMTQPSMERMLDIELDTFDEMGVASKKHLIIELIGSSANIVLTAEDGIVIDCLRRVEGEPGVKRSVLPGLFYRPPKASEKRDPMLAGKSEIAELWNGASRDKTFDAWLMDSFFGISPLVCRELSLRFFGDSSMRICDIAEGTEELPERLFAFFDSVRRGEVTPTMLTDAGKPADFSCIPIMQYGLKMERTEFKSFSEMLDAFYTKRDIQDNVRQRAQTLIKTVKSMRDRRVRKLALQQEELKATYGRERLRELGDIITANLYRMEQGAKTLRAEDFYAEGSPEIEIKLDPLRSPQQNAAKYFKDYTKAKKANQHLQEQIKTGETERDYLESVLDELSRAQGERDIAEIRQELDRMGYLPQKKGGKREKEVRSRPLKFTSSTGFTILVGKNNTQNDELTFKSAERFDTWLHTQKIHGSHVIIKADGREVDDVTLNEAACIAACFSQASGAQKVPVDYTLIKYVKKPAGAKPGMAIYTDYKTLIVSADEKIIEKLKDK